MYLSGYKLGPPLLDWNTVQQKLPWGVIILLGGGFALADMCKVSSFNADDSRLLFINTTSNVTWAMGNHFLILFVLFERIERGKLASEHMLTTYLAK